ncbi:MAG TPA: hypothetical protein VGL00_05425 [Terracidiphilus sp.]
MIVTVPIAPDDTEAVNAALELLAGTATDAGTFTPALLLDVCTIKPPAGAGPVKFAWQDAVPGALTDEEPQVTELTATGAVLLPTVNCTVFDRPLNAPVSVTIPVAPDETVDENPALELPAGTTTQVGTVTPALLLDICTPEPPAGAGPVRFTWQDSVPGAVTDEEPQVTELNALGVAVLPTLNCTVFEIPLNAPVRSTVPAVPDATLAENPALELPPGTTTQVGTVTPVLLLVI